MRRHGPAALRAALLLGAGDDAEDVVQEAFVKAYRGLGRFREGSPFRPWLLRIVANEARNLHRSAGRRVEREARAWREVAPLLAGPDVADGAVEAAGRAELVAAVGRLPAAQREVVTCRYLLDLDEAETAAVLGRPRGTVKSQSHRALRSLAADLGRGSDGAPGQPEEVAGGRA